MRKVMFKGARVSWQGRTGTVLYDSDEGWETASIEFDDEKGVVIQKLKSELTYNTAEYEAVLSSNVREMISLAEELESSAQYDNSDYSIRQTMDDVAAKLRKLAAQ